VDEDGIGGWPLAAVEQFRSLVSASSKAVVRKIVDGKQIYISIYTP